MEPVSTRNGEHYIWGDVCDGWHLARAAGLSVIEERMPSAAGSGDSARSNKGRATLKML